MPRDPRSIPPSGIWASAGDTETFAAAGITISEGWDAEFSEQGGRNPTRESFNTLVQLIFASINELNKGFFEWDASISYAANSYTVASDGRIYKSVQASTNQDPTAPNSAYWSPLINNTEGTNQNPLPPTATQARQGIVELASNQETIDGTDNLRAVTPESLAAKIASYTLLGLMQFATASEVQAGTVNNKAISPADLETKTATTGRKGILSLASNSEVEAGTEGTKAVTSSSLQAKFDARFWFGNRASYDAIAVKDPTIIYHIYE